MLKPRPQEYIVQTYVYTYVLIKPIKFGSSGYTQSGLIHTKTQINFKWLSTRSPRASLVSLIKF